MKHKIREPAKLEADIKRKHRAMAAAARTRADAFGRNLGGGAGVDAAAKEAGVGKPAVNEARAKLAEALTSPDGRPVAGLSKEALEVVSRVAIDKEQAELWVVREAPWRLEHAAAREKFPPKNG